MNNEPICNPTALSFIKEIEPLIDGLVNPIAAYWVNDSLLFKQLQDIAQGTSINSISHRATACYLWMQLELVDAVFIPINETIIRCINYSNDINSAAMSSDTLGVKQIKDRSVLEFLTSTFKTKKALYWLKAQLKLKHLLLDPASHYYQLVDAAMKAQIQHLTAPWLRVMDAVKSRSAANFPALILQLLLTEVSCISGWKTARSVFEQQPCPALAPRTAAAPHYHHAVVFSYFGRLKGAPVTCTDETVRLAQRFSFTASASTLYHTTRALCDELSAADRATIVDYLHGEQSLGTQMLACELSIVQAIDRWLFETCD